MSWQDIIKENLTEKVIEALIPFYGSREKVFDSYILGVTNEKDLETHEPYTKEDVKALIKDMDFAATSFGDMERKKYQETRNQLKELL